MGGKPYLNEADKISRKYATYRKYQDKQVGLPITEKRRAQNRKSSLAYYYRNQDLCIEKAAEYNKNHKVEHSLSMKKLYQKRKYSKEVVFIKKSKIIENKCQKDSDSELGIDP